MMEIPSSVVAATIQRGDILLSEFDGIDHRKYFVVMGVSQEQICGFFFINSNIHPAIFNKQDQLELQYPMHHADYPFLKYDSFLCASSVIERKLTDIAESISQGTTIVKGRMKQEHVDEVVTMVLSSRVISTRHKQLYFLNCKQ